MDDRQTGVSLLLIVEREKSSGRRRRKRSCNIKAVFRIGSTSVLPRCERRIRVPFEENNDTSGHSAQPWVSKTTTELLKLSIIATEFSVIILIALPLYNSTPVAQPPKSLLSPSQYTRPLGAELGDS
ncbi:hypothetical protein TNCV_4875141 [Trichonephila clavipes]|nr:hypothetical protein TNCV_4875141 [Trichonephila clavipes]